MNIEYDENYSYKVIENLPDWKKKLLKKQFGLTNKAQKRKNKIKMKPIKAWAVLDVGFVSLPLFFKTKNVAKIYVNSGSRCNLKKIIRVEIREVGK